jgi:DNA-binding CsgD family transcriptional regulator
MLRSVAMLRAGLPREAQLDGANALEIALETGGERSGPIAFIVAASLAWLLEALIELGELDEAERTLETTPLDDRLQDSPLLNFVVLQRGLLRVTVGDYEAGLAALFECGERNEAWQFDNPSNMPWRTYAAPALFALGDTDRARALVNQELELARQFGVAMPIGRALRVLGVLEGGPQGIELLREASEILDTSPSVIQRAKGRIELGAALRRANQPSDARDQLRVGLTLATRAGAPPLIKRAEEELLAAGSKPRGPGFRLSDELTPSERRVAILAREGKSNKAIAQELFVTIKTVEMHLSNAYRKLEISSRKELSDADLGAA